MRYKYTEKNTPIRQSIHLPLCFPVFHGCHAIFVSKNALVGSHIAKTGIDSDRQRRLASYFLPGSHIAKTGIDSDSLNRIMLEIFQQHKRIIESQPIDVSVEIFACESLQ